MINTITHENSLFYFVADDQGEPVSFGYLSREQAEHVEQLIEASEGQAKIPTGINIEKILKDCR